MYRNASNLSSLSHIRHGFFDRFGGVSKSPYDSLNVGLNVGDDIKDVMQNRAIVRDAMGVKKDIYLNQCHSKIASFVDHTTGLLEHDAMLTREKALLLCVQTADCAPILIAHKEKPLIAAIHAGWRGAIGGVVQSALDLMEDHKNLVCAIGPCKISLELDYQDLPCTERTSETKMIFHMGEYLKNILESYGISDIELLGENDEYYFSYRRNHISGRQVSCIGLI